ncbi:MAG: CbiX/SirB N-terminal domain-containing protein [Rhodocyclaceae bacterium]|nr:CbiX/SirB N-terminal domain-containing protein [Rhodocyclaceae bacterium]
MSQMHGIVLFGHGARDPVWAGPMQRTAARIAELSPEMPVELAFMEFIEPVLDVAVDRLVARGATRITVVPVFLAQGGHLKRDVPALVSAAAARHAGVSVTLATAAGEAPEVIDAIAAYASRC